MNTIPTKILLKCPYSGEYFEQKRSNQFFRSPKDGTAFRNALNFFNDPDHTKKQKAALFNLKRLVRFFRIGWLELDQARFKMLRLKPEGLTLIQDYLGNDNKHTVHKVFGFWIFYDSDKEKYYIVPPEGSRDLNG